MIIICYHVGYTVLQSPFIFSNRHLNVFIYFFTVSRPITYIQAYEDRKLVPQDLQISGSSSSLLSLDFQKQNIPQTLKEVPQNSFNHDNMCAPTKLAHFDLSKREILFLSTRKNSIIKVYPTSKNSNPEGVNFVELPFSMQCNIIKKCTPPHSPFCNFAGSVQIKCAG